MWDGKSLTFTNIQQSGTQRVLYIDGSTLEFSTKRVEDLGESAVFKCKKEESGRYSLFNEKTGLYMIWRSGATTKYGYNNNSGTLAGYNPTYCDWQIVDGSAKKANTYYIVGKRSNGSTDGSLIIMSSGDFDSYGASAGWDANFSNLFYINVASDLAGIGTVEALTELVNGKVLKNGRIVIVHDGIQYDVTGQRLK